MRTSNEKIKYFLYCRKSTEDDDRQVLSLSSQIDELKKLAKRLDLKIVGEPMYESKSAKAPGREVFNDMLKRIENGEAQGVICWKLDRLARNPVDDGKIKWMLQKGIIRHIRTPERDYFPEDNVLLASLEFGMANQYIRDLSTNVKRGLRAKTQQGWRNGIAPIGYLNNIASPKGEKNIVPDPVRFDLVRRIFEEYIAGHYSVRQLHRQAKKWGLTTRQTKKQGGKPASLAHIYRLLTEPFYTGHFYTRNHETGEKELVKGAHEPMITMDQFELMQHKLGRRGKPQSREGHFFPFTGRTECGECGSMVTAEEKHQIICDGCKYKFASPKRDACPKCSRKIADMENPTTLHYVYYHCTRRKNPKCSQKSVRVEDLEYLLDSALTKFELSSAFTQWALEELAKDNDDQIKGQRVEVESQDKRYKDVVQTLQNLTRLYTSPENADQSLLSLEEYTPQRKVLMDEKHTLDGARQNTGRKIDEWVDWAENSFSFAVAARIWFEVGTPEQKRDIFASLSRSNLILKDKELAISLRNPLDLYAAIAMKYPNTTKAFEPRNGGSVKAEYLPFAVDIPSLRRR
ncbi:MAG: recombinase family protein [Minisyncoccia bacterium]